MSKDLRLFDISLNSSGDESSNQYKACVASSAVSAGGLAIVAARGGRFTGVLQDKSTAAGISSLVRVAGITKMAAGDSSGMETAITEGLPVICSSNGQAVPSTAATDAKIGTALEPLATDSTGIISVLLGVGLTTG